MRQVERLMLALASSSILISNPSWATRTREALERYNLIELKLERVYMPKAGDYSGPLAFFHDEAGYSYRAPLGSYVGKNDGRIVSISADDVVIVELHEIKGGGYQEVKLVLHPLRKEPKPAPAG